MFSLPFFDALRSLPASVMALVLACVSKQALIACTKGKHYSASLAQQHLPHSNHLVNHSGAATTASRLGMPDLAIATLNDFVQSAQMVCSLSPSTPVIADADTGFGGTAMVARTVTQYARAGVAAMHIEDQVQTKRCGHLMGKQVVSREEFITRIRAAVIARDSIPGGSDFVIIGRTDSAQVLGMEEAVTRLKLAADAGADVCFIEGVKTQELLESTVAALAPKPVLVNVISGGLTPSFTCKEAEAMGAKIISEFIVLALYRRSRNIVIP